MATFEVQVEALTTIAIESSATYPTQAQLTQFLTDGAREVINVLPADLLQYCVKYTAMTSSSALNIGTDTDIGKVLYVTRTNGTRYLSCRLIPAVHAGLANDPTNSTYYGTDFDPVYYIISDGTNPGLKVFPEPSSAFNARVHHVAYPAVAYGDSDIDNFPDGAEYLVILYGAMKSLLSAIGALQIPPDAFGDATALTSAASALTDGQLGTDAEFREFDMWFTALGEMIEDDEDIELAGAQIEKINSYVNTWNIQLQGNLAEMQQYMQMYQLLQADYIKGINALRSGNMQGQQQGAQ